MSSDQTTYPTTDEPVTLDSPPGPTPEGEESLANLNRNFVALVRLTHQQAVRRERTDRDNARLLVAAINDLVLANRQTSSAIQSQTHYFERYDREEERKIREQRRGVIRFLFGWLW